MRYFEFRYPYALITVPNAKTAGDVYLQQVACEPTGVMVREVQQGRAMVLCRLAIQITPWRGFSNCLNSTAITLKG